MALDLVDLRLLVSTAETGSMTAAAHAQNLVVTAVSNRLRRLEQDAGVTLFDRTGRGVRPTVAGARMIEHAHRILNEARLAEATLSSFTSGNAGRVRLSVNTDMLFEHMPRALGPFLATWPEISIDLDARPSLELVELLRQGEVDIGIVADPVDRQGLDCIPFVPDRFAVLVPATWLEGTREVTFTRLLDMPLLGLEQSAPLMQFLERQSHVLGRPLEIRMRMPDFEALAELASAGAGVAIVAESAARRLVAGRDVRVLRLSERWAERVLWLATRKRSQLPVYARQLFEHLSAYARAPEMVAAPRRNPTQS